MKNLKLLSITFLTLFSCSDEIEPPLSNLSDNSKDFQQLIKEKYNGEILKFDDEKDFISFYEILSDSKQEEFDYFLSIKDNNNSSFYCDLFNEEKNNINDYDYNNKDLIISEYLSSIFNYNNEIIINEKTISLKATGDLVSYDPKRSETKIIGNITSSQDIYNNAEKSTVISNSKSWIFNTFNGRRVILTIFKETISLNSGITKKLMLRVHQQYESCSFWRCTWKDDNRISTLKTYFTKVNGCNWQDSFSPLSISNAITTKKISDYKFQGPCTPGYNITGYATYGTSPEVFYFNDINYSFSID